MQQKGFWAVLVFLVIGTAALWLEDWKFLSGNPWYEHELPRFHEVLERQEEVPVVVREFVGFNVKNDVSFLGLKTGRYVSKSCGVVVAFVFIVFLYLGIRQNRMAREIRELRLTLGAGGVELPDLTKRSDSPGSDRGVPSR